MALPDTQNQAWAKDKSGFGFRMLQRMGWGEGKGLGKNEDGMSTHVKIKKRAENLAIGAEADATGNAVLSSAVVDYNRLLASLSKTAAVGNTTASSSAPSVASRTRSQSDASDSSPVAAAPQKPAKHMKRIAYGRMLRAKDVSGYSATDLRAVLGGTASVAAPAAPHSSPGESAGRKRPRARSEASDAADSAPEKGRESPPHKALLTVRPGAETESGKPAKKSEKEKKEKKERKEKKGHKDKKQRGPQEE